MAMLTFDEVMDRLSEDRPIDQSQVPTQVQDRKVWVASNYNPGCMPDSSNVCRTKADAISTCLQIADNGEGPPRGMKTELSASGTRWFDVDGYRYKVEQMTVRELL